MSDQGFPASGAAAQTGERVWLVHDRERQLGPYSAVELAGLLATRQILPSALAWRPGNTQWIPVTAAVPLPAANPGVTPLAPVDSKRVLAGVMGILLGSLGIHKFILGYTGAGLVMLLVTLALALPTCGGGAAIMGTIGLIEGILYLCKSDAEFYNDYIVGRRTWF